ncbi:DUF2500 family protein [Armatimonas sp.]|uniref:DUF2500 family protein n=1 Tax=Armatimonas sp. TaxID=1872638 RepID=UPI003752328A
MSTELIVLLLLGGCIVLWGAQSLRTWWANRCEAELLTPAVVLEKSLVHQPGSGWEPDQRHVLTFSLPDGSRRHFAVTEAQYQKVHAGDSGQLHTRGSWFRGFEIAQ